jgi:hypothetical protein
MSAPAMGERIARWGYGYQDRVATQKVLEKLKEDANEGFDQLVSIRLADLEAGRVDDFVIELASEIEGYSIKSTTSGAVMNWSDLIGSQGLVRELADGWTRLCRKWPDKRVSVHLVTNKAASSSTHPAQIVSEVSVRDFTSSHWKTGPTDSDTPTVADAWQKIAEHANLSATEFPAFIRATELSFAFGQPPYPAGDNLDQQTYLRQFDQLHKAIATWITNQPNEESIARRYLLDAIGLGGYRTGLIQVFPQSQIAYAKNLTSAERINRAIASTRGGYLAVVGPAGVGKSTLVQDVLSEYPLSIPYFAYLPDGLGNARERGDALTFFRDVVGRLDRNFEGRLALGVNDLAQGKQALRDHMHRARDLFRNTGQKTILLIDGLDHIQREDGINCSLLQELPRPDEVPEGFVIILSSQPQTLAAGVIERHVAMQVSPSSSARIEVDGLSRNEVHEIASRTDSSLSHDERDLISNACHGNPLILTYLLKFKIAHPEMVTDEAITTVGEYSGDIEAYYDSSLSVALQDNSTRQALALLSRAIVPVPMRWLQSWPERREFEQIYERHLQPFVKVEDGQLFFIHNSLLVFLRNNTRSRMPGVDFETDERDLHKELAVRCGSAPCSDRIGRAKIHYLRHGGQKAELLAALPSDWLREGIEAFIPHVELRPLILHGFACAWSLGRFGEVLRLILLDFESGQRTNRIDAADLAANFLKLDDPQRAMSQVRSAGRILVEERDEFEAAETLGIYGVEHDIPNISQLGREIYLHAKPINYLYRSQPMDYHDAHSALQSLRKWASCAPHFETADQVCEQILGLKFTEREGDWQEPQETTKAELIRAAFLTASANDGAYEGLFPYLRALAKLRALQLFFASLIVAYRAAPSARLLRALRRRFKTIEGQQDLSLLYAEILLREGNTTDARELCNGLKHTGIDENRDQHTFGLTGISYNTRLARLRNILDIPTEPPLPVAAANQEPGARVFRACVELGHLLARAWIHEIPVDLKDALRSILLFGNRSVSTHEIDVHGRITLSRSSDAIYSQLVTVASLFGDEGMKSLRDAFIEVIESGASVSVTPAQYRRFALEFADSNVMTPDEAVNIGLSNDSDVRDDDPAVRVQACFDIAAYLKNLGQTSRVPEWITKASKASAGTGEHKDYHMWHVAEWIILSCEHHPGKREVRSIDQFLRSAQVAGGDGAWRACSTILAHLIGSSPDRACRLAIEFVDKDMLSVSDCLSALLRGAASHGASPSLLGALYSNLQLILATADSADTADAILRSVEPAKQIDVALRLAEAVRTNAIPDRRAGILRTLQDSLFQLGKGEILAGVSLLSGRDDSAMKSSLYRLSTGELKTQAEMTRRLSDLNLRADWNPHPSQNEEFDWQSVVVDVDISDVEHANILLESFNFSKYAEVGLLAWQSRVQLKAGDRVTAKRLAEDAVRVASPDGTWFERLDGAKLKVAYTALIATDRSEGIRLARERFGADLESGKLWSTLLLSDIPEIFDTLQIPWPGNEVLDTVAAYLDKALVASRESAPMEALNSSEAAISTDAALCRFAIHLLGFPVFEVGLGARKSLAEFAVEDQDGAAIVFSQNTGCDSIQLEHLLASIDCRPDKLPAQLQQPIELLHTHESIAVRSIAYRLCQKNGWRWIELRDQPHNTPIILPHSNADDDPLSPYSIAVVAAQSSPRIFTALRREGYEWDRVVSQLFLLCREVEVNYTWREAEQLAEWVSSVHSAFWVDVRALTGREASMRLFGSFASSALVPAGAEKAYDVFHPIYDSAIDLLRPQQLPAELGTADWLSDDTERRSWAEGKNADSWTNYPQTVDGLYLLGERTMLTRPVWEWLREERYRGLSLKSLDSATPRESFMSSRQLTYEMYLEGYAQPSDQLIVCNNEQQLLGSTYSWVAFNTKAARQLGWIPSTSEPFRWDDASGAMMVKSIYWRNGWIGLKPPHLISLGQGWMVVASDAGIRAIKAMHPKCTRQLWVSRDQSGRDAFSQQWHLQDELHT